MGLLWSARFDRQHNAVAMAPTTVFWLAQSNTPTSLEACKAFDSTRCRAHYYPGNRHNSPCSAFQRTIDDYLSQCWTGQSTGTGRGDPGGHPGWENGLDRWRPGCTLACHRARCSPTVLAALA